MSLLPRAVAAKHDVTKCPAPVLVPCLCDQCLIVIDVRGVIMHAKQHLTCDHDEWQTPSCSVACSCFRMFKEGPISGTQGQAESPFSTQTPSTFQMSPPLTPWTTTLTL